ncbi:Protein phosphatase PP2A regulatory subunit B [Coemansia sp. RSA 522]|nr:Protein phosphatase PP2A regulatory subunit B [Coemansia sp. RSA 522]
MCVTKHKRIREREKTAEVVTAERRLRAGSYVVPNLQLFEEYLRARADVAVGLTRHYNETKCRQRDGATTPGVPLHRKLRLSAYINRQQADQLLVNRLRAKFKPMESDPEPIFIMGNWGAPMTRFHEPIRGKGWRRLLKRAGFEVYLIDEHRTSSLCPNCEEHITTFLDVPNPRPWMRPRRPIASSPAPAAAPVPAAAPTSAEAPASAPAATESAISNASLYVGELDPSVTEAILFELFNMVGPVASIRVCRDAITRRSLGYAYVNFHNRADGERALDMLNYTLIKDKECRIMWSQRDPALRRSSKGNVFIKNLDATIDNKALHDTFAAFGDILSCKVVTDQQGVSRGFGFVHYETEEAALQAIKNVNGMLLNDTKVFVGLHISRAEREAHMEEARANFTNVYVKDLDADVDADELKALFEKYGEITSVYMPAHDDGTPRGFGFINFADHEAARTAVKELHESEFKGKKLYVSRAQKKTEREKELRVQYEQTKMEKLSKFQGGNLYIKNFDETMDDDMLRQEFAPYGTITSARVMRDDKGASLGFGFVCYSAPAEATTAIAEMNGRMVGKKPLYVVLAQRRDQRRQQIEATKRQWQGGAPMGPHVYGPPPMYYPPGYVQQRGAYPAPRPVRWQGAQPVPGQYPMPGQYPVPQYPVPAGQRPMRPRNPRQGSRGGYAGRGRGGYRSNPRTQGPGQQETTQAEAPVESEPASLTAAALAAAPEEERKQMLGEALYPLIEARTPDMAGKITGMLLEMEDDDLLLLIDDSVQRDAKIDEALEVLNSQGPADAE